MLVILVELRGDHVMGVILTPAHVTLILHLSDILS